MSTKKQIISKSKSKSKTRSKYKAVGDSIIDRQLSILEYIDETGIVHEVQIVTIPKGTILFRSLGYSDKNADYCGIEEPESFCLHKNHNVFFYPYPGYSDAYADEEGNMTVFMVKRDLKVLNLLTSDSFNRSDRHTNESIFQSCDKIEKTFCGKNEGRRFDPCFTKHFIESNPDVVGMYSIAEVDSVQHKMIYENLDEYSLFSKDSKGNQGIPELMLYPYKERFIEEQKWSLEDCKKQRSSLNFKELFTEQFDVYEDNVFKKIFNAYLSPQGYNGQHITIFSPLKLYVMYEKLHKKYKKDCVPLLFDNRSKLLQFQKDINKLNDELYDKKFSKAHTEKDIKSEKYIYLRKIELFFQEEKQIFLRTIIKISKKNNLSKITLDGTAERVNPKDYGVELRALYKEINVGDIILYVSKNKLNESYYIVGTDFSLLLILRFSKKDNSQDTFTIPFSIIEYMHKKSQNNWKKYIAFFHKKGKQLLVPIIDENILKNYDITNKKLVVSYYLGFHNMNDKYPKLKVVYSNGKEIVLSTSEEELLDILLSMKDDK